MTARIRAIGAASFAAFALALAACSPPNQQDTTMEKTDTASDIAAPSKTASSSMKSTSAAPETSTESGTVNLKVSNINGIKDGDELTVDVSGLDPKMGYYAAICAAEATPDNPVPVCTGKTGDTETQAWIKSQGGTVPLSEDGTASAKLIAASTGEGLDCTVDACVVKVFGDHSQGFTDIVSVPVTFAK
ncbi:hypothetical protein [Corynebacterium freiburgense]|uniref:hypothetical protein n=1 Tax=Corynebacterium freiburgense TaxID=556548 RepID=UPI000478B400|nr:hypothetical protein [Corynebacterium freiburgense]WJZ03347.1 hypothetical protein CFREI_10365 [Corynebacterium freiburgense]